MNGTFKFLANLGGNNHLMEERRQQLLLSDAAEIENDRGIGDDDHSGKSFFSPSMSS